MGALIDTLTDNRVHSYVFICLRFDWDKRLYMFECLRVLARMCEYTLVRVHTNEQLQISRSVCFKAKRTVPKQSNLYKY